MATIATSTWLPAASLITITVVRSLIRHPTTELEIVGGSVRICTHDQEAWDAPEQIIQKDLEAENPNRANSAPT
jgi:hypothetical protein